MYVNHVGLMDMMILWMNKFFNNNHSALPTILSLMLKLLGKPFHWSPSSVLPLKNFFHPLQATFCACTLWALWQWNNFAKHDPVKCSIPHFCNIVIFEFQFALNCMSRATALLCPCAMLFNNSVIVI